MTFYFLNLYTCFSFVDFYSWFSIDSQFLTIFKIWNKCTKQSHHIQTWLTSPWESASVFASGLGTLYTTLVYQQQIRLLCRVLKEFSTIYHSFHIKTLLFAHTCKLKQNIIEKLYYNCRNRFLVILANIELGQFINNLHLCISKF